VVVEGVKNLILQNDSAVLNPNKPFNPFGSQPVVGSAFYIGSKEIFSKKVDLLTLNITWHGLPKDGFKTYYMAYNPVNEEGNPIIEIKNE